MHCTSCTNITLVWVYKWNWIWYNLDIFQVFLKNQLKISVLSLSTFFIFSRLFALLKVMHLRMLFSFPGKWKQVQFDVKHGVNDVQCHGVVVSILHVREITGVPLYRIIPSAACREFCATNFQCFLLEGELIYLLFKWSHLSHLSELWRILQSVSWYHLLLVLFFQSQTRLRLI